jgi:hypothetical protein
VVLEQEDRAVRIEYGDPRGLARRTQRLAQYGAGPPQSTVPAALDDLVAEGRPERQATGVVVEYRQTHGDTPGPPEPLLDEGRQPASVPPPLSGGVDEQQPDPRVGVGRIGMASEGDGDPDEPPLPALAVPGVAREQDLRLRVGQLHRQGRGHLFGTDVVRVREVTAQGVEVAVGGVQGGEFGEEGAGDGSVLGGAQGCEQQHAPHAIDRVRHRLSSVVRRV